MHSKRSDAKKVLGGSEETEWEQARCIPEKDGDERMGGGCHQRERTRSCEMQTLRKSPEIKGLKKELRYKAIEFLKQREHKAERWIPEMK